jgi:hypothetical protein
MLATCAPACANSKIHLQVRRGERASVLELLGRFGWSWRSKLYHRRWSWRTGVRRRKNCPARCRCLTLHLSLKFLSRLFLGTLRLSLAVFLSFCGVDLRAVGHEGPDLVGKLAYYPLCFSVHLIGIRNLARRLNYATARRRSFCFGQLFHFFIQRSYSLIQRIHPFIDGFFACIQLCFALSKLLFGG